MTMPIRGSSTLASAISDTWLGPTMEGSDMRVLIRPLSRVVVS